MLQCIYHRADALYAATIKLTYKMVDGELILIWDEYDVFIYDVYVRQRYKRHRQKYHITQKAMLPFCHASQPCRLNTDHVDGANFAIYIRRHMIGRHCNAILILFDGVPQRQG